MNNLDKTIKFENLDIITDALLTNFCNLTIKKFSSFINQNASIPPEPNKVEYLKLNPNRHIFIAPKKEDYFLYPDVNKDAEIHLSYAQYMAKQTYQDDLKKYNETEKMYQKGDKIKDFVSFYNNFVCMGVENLGSLKDVKKVLSKKEFYSCDKSAWEIYIEQLSKQKEKYLKNENKNYKKIVEIDNKIKTTLNRYNKIFEAYKSAEKEYNENLNKYNQMLIQREKERKQFLIDFDKNFQENIIEDSSCVLNKIEECLGKYKENYMVDFEKAYEKILNYYIEILGQYKHLENNNVYVKYSLNYAGKHIKDNLTKLYLDNNQIKQDVVLSKKTDNIIDTKCIKEKE